MSTSAAVLEVDADPQAMSWTATREGWGDGLPLVPPTAELVAEFVAASGLAAEESLGEFTVTRSACTVERVAVNAVMAGAPPESMPLICASLEAMIDPAFELRSTNTTTASTTPAILVNGPIRDRLGIPYSQAPLGGAACLAPAIGRAIRLTMRNVAGQAVGSTSESVFGQPARVVGLVFGEWEERSPWEPLAQRRGVAGDAVTVFSTLGTCNILDTVSQSGEEILQVIGKSLAYMGNNNFDYSSTYAEQMVLINPVWASDVIARDIPALADVEQVIYEAAQLPLDWFPQPLRPGIEERDRLDQRGMVRLMDSPADLHVAVCGGLGNLHAAMLPGFSHSRAITRPVPAR